MAIDPRTIELIHADIDGEIDAEDKAHLEAFLAGSAEGRALHTEFLALAQSLDALGELDPPAHLKHVLLNAAPARTPTARRPGLWSRLFPAPALGYLGIFAAGVLLTLALVDSSEISNRAFDDVTGLVGTVADLEAIGPSLASVVVDQDEVAGTVTLRSRGPLLILDFDLSAQESVEIVARYSDSTIWFNGFAQLESSGTSVAAETGLVRLGMDGKRRYAVFLNNPGNRPARIEMQFVAGGEVIHEANMEFAG
jgi:hypothetical protein